MPVMHILVAEDEATISRLIIRVLGAAGFNVTGVRTCAEAIEHVTTSAFNLLLLDLHLSDGDGFGVIEAMAGSGRKTPVVVMTGESNFDEDPRAQQVSAVLRKPFNLDELEAVVRQHCA